MASEDAFGFVGPSLAEPNQLPPQGIFHDGYNKNGSIKIYTTHNYMGDCSQIICSLQGTLMNHSSVTASLSAIANEISPLNNGPLIAPLTPNTIPPFVLDETNSLLSVSEGPKNISNVFGAALWVVDYMLYAATIGISRVHLQQGTGFGYNAWQPITVGDGSHTKKGVYPPYYGAIAVAAAVGNITADAPLVVEIALPDADDFESAYGIYAHGNRLARIAVVNMHAFNATTNTNTPSQGSRQNRTYTFSVPAGANIPDGHVVRVQRLVAAGSDVVLNVTWDGWSYDLGLDGGRPVKVGPETNETVTVSGGMVSVGVLDSEAAVLSF